MTATHWTRAQALAHFGRVAKVGAFCFCSACNALRYDLSQAKTALANCRDREEYARLLNTIEDLEEAIESARE